MEDDGIFYIGKWVWKKHCNHTHEAIARCSSVWEESRAFVALLALSSAAMARASSEASLQADPGCTASDQKRKYTTGTCM